MAANTSGTSQQSTAALHRSRSKQHTDRDLASSDSHANNVEHLPLEDHPDAVARFLWRLKGGGRYVPTWGESLIAIATSSWLNVLLIFIPIAWASHFAKWNPNVTFPLALLAIIPLEKLFDFGGDEFSLYCGQSLGDLVIITLDNVVEVSLAIILLTKCELRLMQATVVGVVLLHLLLAPGVAFITGGARLLQQELDPHVTELNHSLLTIGVLTLLIPAAFFAAIGNNVARSASEGGAEGGGGEAGEAARRALRQIVSFAEEKTQSAVAPVSDDSRDNFLRLSRGLAIVLLIIYISSRIYLHNPPGQNNSLKPLPNAPIALREKEHEKAHEKAKVNPWSCLLLFAITIPLTAATAEWLVDSLEHVRENSGIKEEWFGLILLPVVSFAADALVTIGYFCRKMITTTNEAAPDPLAKGRTIDLSIQFTLFWMPFLILLAWWLNKPLFLLFDLFEVAIVIGACFLVNTTTKDAKTNWVEGLVMVSFYVMIATATWFYDGQQTVAEMLNCGGSVAEAIAHNST